MKPPIWFIILSEWKAYMANIVKVEKFNSEFKNNCNWNSPEIDVQVHLSDLDNRSSHNPTSWQYPIINYSVFNANNSTNTSEYFSLSLNTVNRKGNLRLPEFGQDDILVKPTSINNWILLPSEGCFDFLHEKCTKFNKIFLSAEETMYRNSLISAV